MQVAKSLLAKATSRSLELFPKYSNFGALLAILEKASSFINSDMTFVYRLQYTVESIKNVVKRP